jgi:hypothetical protein
MHSWAYQQSMMQNLRGDQKPKSHILSDFTLTSEDWISEGEELNPSDGSSGNGPKRTVSDVDGTPSRVAVCFFALVYIIHDVNRKCRALANVRGAMP